MTSQGSETQTDTDIGMLMFAKTISEQNMIINH